MKKITAIALTVLLLGYLSLAAQAIKPPTIKNGKFVSAQEVKLSETQKLWTIKFRAKCPHCGTVSENIGSGIYAPDLKSSDPHLGECPTVCDKCESEFNVVIVQ